MPNQEFVCTFAGHRQVFEPKIEERVKETLESLTGRGRRLVFLCGGMGQFDALCAGAVRWLKKKHPEKDIQLYINSPGGSVTAGMAIYDTMGFVKSPISTICIGMAASMASVLLASGDKGKRFILPNSEVMIHQPLGGVNGQATEIKIVADRILYLRNKLNKILSDKTGKDISEIEKDTERDYYLNASDALEYGLVDKIL